jgi:hypothetical protein
MDGASVPSAALAVVLALASACGTSRPPVDTGDGDGDAASSSGGGASSTDSGGSPSDAAPRTCASGTFALTLLNYDGWCKVTVAGAGLSTATSVTVCIPPGATNLVAVPSDGSHEIGPIPWYGTRNDTGSGDPGSDQGSGVTELTNADITVTNAAKCASVCCPFTDGTGCPGSNQCL